MVEPTRADVTETEPDPRFPSGPWTGFFLQGPGAERHWMELTLTFGKGKVRGEGRDRVGEFLITGRYAVEDGKCRWNKAYLGQHSIAYQGYNEGKGIWGTWEYNPAWRGGFRIWPVGMPDPTLARLAEAIDEPAPTPIDWIGHPSEVGEPVGAEVGGPV